MDKGRNIGSSSIVWENFVGKTSTLTGGGSSRMGRIHQIQEHFGTTSGQWTQGGDLETSKFLSQKVYIIKMPTTGDSDQGENQDNYQYLEKNMNFGKI